MYVASYLIIICFAHKEKQQLNGQIIIIHEYQLSDILTKADFYPYAQIINPSIKDGFGSKICALCLRIILFKREITRLVF